MKKILYTIMFIILMVPGFANAVAPDAAKKDPLYYRLMQTHHSVTNSLDYRLTEYEMRAVFIYKIATGHIAWPDNKKKTTIHFCVTGESNLFTHETLKELVNLGKKDGYIWEINTNADYHQIPACDIVYVNTTKPDIVRYAILATKKKPILTIGESNNFTTHEFGMIGLNLTNKQTIGLSINTNYMKEKGLEASPDLINAADVYN
jgi:hypothetical protein